MSKPVETGEAPSAPPVKLVLVYNSDPFVENIGGTRRYMRFLLREGLRKGARVKFVGVKMGERTSAAPGIEFIHLFTADSLQASEQWWRYLLLSLVRVPFLRLDPDAIIHAGRLLFLLPYCIWKRPNPKVCTSDMPQMVAAQSYPGWLFRVLSAVYDVVEAFIMRRTDAVIAAHHVLREYYQARYPEAKDKLRFDLDPATGVDLDLFQPRDRNSVRRELDIPTEEKVVLFVGRIHQVKGVDFLIDAFSRFSSIEPGARFLVVGEDWAEGYYHKYAKEYPQCHIEFLGEKRGLELARLYNCADLLVLGSVEEGNPTVVREAICSGLPVVSTDVGDVKDLLVTPALGEVVKERSPEKFAEAMLRVCALEQDRVLAASRQERIKYSDEAVFEGVYNLYLGLLRSPGRVGASASSE